MRLTTEPTEFQAATSKLLTELKAVKPLPRPIDSLECEANGDPDWHGIARRSALLRSVDRVQWKATAADPEQPVHIVPVAAHGRRWRGVVAAVVAIAATAAALWLGVSSVMDEAPIVQRAIAGVAR